MALNNPTQAFKIFLQQQNLEGAKLLLMVSGGVDSIVLLHVATQVVKPENLAVFHLNHNARPEAQKDEFFVQNLCSKLNIKFYSQLLYPGINKNSASRSRDQENQWRKERQQLSANAASNFGAVRILTAHHATDLVETMIFRLTKGSGPGGLAPFDVSTKPFWQLPKQTLLDYATEHQLEWREDDSNLNTKFERNLIRSQVLPALRKITPNLEQVFVREAKTFNQLQQFLTNQLQTQCQTELDDKAIALEKFTQLEPIMQAELLRTIAIKTPSQSELEDCLKWLTNKPQGNSEKMIGGTQLKLQQNQLYW